MSTADQLLTWILNSVRGEDLPVKLEADGSEFLIIQNPSTKRIEKIKNNVNDSSKLWAEYSGDFLDNTGLLKLGKLDNTLTINVDSVNNKVKIIGGTELQRTDILGSLRINNDSVLISSDEVEINAIDTYIESENIEIESGIIQVNSSSLMGFSSNQIALLSNDDKLKVNGVDLDFSNVTEEREVSFPDKNGTIAYIDDLPNGDDFVTLDTNQIITGNKNFSGVTTSDTLNCNFGRFNSITPITTGLGAVNMKVINAIGETPFIQLNDTNTSSKVVFNLENGGEDVVVTTPTENGKLALKSDTPDWSGWAQYGDSQYTSASPLTIPQGSTAILDIDGLSNTIKTQLPIGVSDFYDVSTSKILGVKELDKYVLGLSFEASNNNNTGDMTFFIDLGGSFTRIFPQIKTFPRGTGVAHEFYINLSYYTGSTFMANGGIMKIESGRGDSSIFNLSLQIDKIHNAR